MAVVAGSHKLGRRAGAGAWDLLLGGPPCCVEARPVVTTASVTDDPDDPAVWVHRREPARSLILGTNKVAAPAGARVVFGLDGKIRQSISGIDRPNNVDVEYGLPLGGERVDIAVLTERRRHRLRIFRIAEDGGRLSSALGPVFPYGLLVAMNSGPKNFLVFRWEDIALAGEPRLQKGAK